MHISKHTLTFFRTAFSLNLADAILWLQASSSYTAHLSLLSLSLNYYFISLSHFTCNFRNCLFKASLSHPSSSNHNQKVESCLWSYCGVRLLCPCFTFSDRCHQTFYHFHSWKDLFVSINRAGYLQGCGWKKHQYSDAYRNIKQWEAAMPSGIISWFLCAPRAVLLMNITSLQQAPSPCILQLKSHATVTILTQIIIHESVFLRDIPNLPLSLCWTTANCKVFPCCQVLVVVLEYE